MNSRLIPYSGKKREPITQAELEVAKLAFFEAGGQIVQLPDMATYRSRQVRPKYHDLLPSKSRYG